MQSIRKSMKKIKIKISEGGNKSSAINENDQNKNLRREGEWRERRREWAGKRKPSLETMVRSGGMLVTRLAKLDERPSAWLVACKETIAAISICDVFKVSSANRAHVIRVSQLVLTAQGGQTESAK